MSTDEDYSRLSLELSSKEADYSKLLNEQKSLLDKIKQLNFKKTSILDLLSSLDNDNQLTTEQELLSLTELQDKYDISVILQLIKKEVKLSDIEVDPVLVQLLNEDNNI